MLLGLVRSADGSIPMNRKGSGAVFSYHFIVNRLCWQTWHYALVFTLIYTACQLFVWKKAHKTHTTDTHTHTHTHTKTHRGGYKNPVTMKKYIKLIM